MGYSTRRFEGSDCHLSTCENEGVDLNRISRNLKNKCVAAMEKVVQCSLSEIAQVRMCMAHWLSRHPSLCTIR